MRRLIWFAVLLAVAAGAFAAGTIFSSRDALVAVSPDGGRTAGATDRRCWSGRCQTLWIRATGVTARVVATLDKGGRCDEIVWTKDGSRVAFLVDGAQLRFYDPASMAPAGQITLVHAGPGDSRSIVRGITFSGNGRAITYDECPRGRSGCRAGLAPAPR